MVRFMRGRDVLLLSVPQFNPRFCQSSARPHGETVHPSGFEPDGRLPSGPSDQRLSRLLDDRDQRQPGHASEGIAEGLLRGGCIPGGSVWRMAFSMLCGLFFQPPFCSLKISVPGPTRGNPSGFSCRSPRRLKGLPDLVRTKPSRIEISLVSTTFRVARKNTHSFDDSRYSHSTKT